jgi:dienelactone hydrolase
MRHALVVAVVLVVVLPEYPATLTWTGNGGSSWSNAANWAPPVTPATGDALVFPAAAAQFDTIPFAVTVSTMTFSGDYTLSSSETVTVTGGINVTGGAPSIGIQTPLRLASANSWSLGAASVAVSSLDVNGQQWNVTQSSGGVLSISNLDGGGFLTDHGGIVRLSQGSFSGSVTVDTLEVEQANINAAVNANSVRGNGSIRTLSVTGDLTPTAPAEGGNAFLSVSSGLVLTNTVVHLTLDTVTPWIVSSGPTTLSNATLSLTSGVHGPADGQSVTVIDGATTASGTFAGLVEGAQVSVGGANYTITYVGGLDHHDILLLWNGTGGARTWTGAAGTLWSNGSNWSPAGVPSSGADMVFPQGAPLVSTNDLTGFSVGKLTINDAYTIGGNGLVVSGGIGRGGPAGAARINADITLGASQTFASTETLPLIFGGRVDVNGQLLTLGDATFNGPLTGNGTITTKGAGVTLAGSGTTFLGSFVNTRLTLNVPAPAASLVHVAGVQVNAPSLTVNGEQTIGDVTISGDLRLNHPAGAASGIVHTGSLRFEGQGGDPELVQPGARYFIDLDGTASDRVDVHGTVSLTNALLEISAPTQPPVGQLYTILANDGSDAVSGRFSIASASGLVTLQEGSIFKVPAGKFRISYLGNDGNDVTLTALDPTKFEVTTTTIASNGPTNFGQPAVFTIGVAPAAATGFVEVRIDSFLVDAVPLAAGAATYTTTVLTVGSHSVTAIYDGDGTYGSSNATISHTVTAPALTVGGIDVATTEGNAGTHTVDVAVALSAVRPNAVSVAYHTESGSAASGEDFLPATGTLVIPAGSLQATVSITIIGDAKPEVDEKFALVLDSTSDGTIPSKRVTVTITDDDPAYARTRFIPYASVIGGGTLTLDVLTPAGVNAPRPAVIALASEADQATIIREAVRGYTVVIPVIRSMFPNNVLDAKTAVRWLRTNAAQYGVDPKRIAVWGIGTGGNVATLLGTSDGIAALEDRDEGSADASSAVAAVVDFYGETDYLALTTPSACSINYISLFGCSPLVCQGLVASASPLQYASSGDAPTLIVHGSADCPVPIAQSTSLKLALDAAGVPATLLTVDGAGHGGPAFQSDTVLQAVDAFLDGYLMTATPTRRRAVHH